MLREFHRSLRPKDVAHPRKSEAGRPSLRDLRAADVNTKQLNRAGTPE